MRGGPPADPKRQDALLVSRWANRTPINKVKVLLDEGNHLKDPRANRTATLPQGMAQNSARGGGGGGALLACHVLASPLDKLACPESRK
jgi:hypothetical protein